MANSVRSNGEGSGRGVTVRVAVGVITVVVGGTSAVRVSGGGTLGVSVLTLGTSVPKTCWADFVFVGVGQVVIPNPP